MTEANIRHFDLPRLLQAIERLVRYQLRPNDHPVHQEAVCTMKRKIFLCANLLHFADTLSVCLMEKHAGPARDTLE